MSRLSRLLRRVLHPVLLLGTGAVWAQATPPPATPPRQAPVQQREPAAQREPVQRDRGGLPDSVRRVERQTGGEVLRAEPMQRDGREVYRLKVLTSDGRVRVMQDDPGRPRGDAQPDRKSGDSRPQGRKGKQDESSRDSDEEPPQ